MTRYVLAGLAMTASVVLLFLASFRPAPFSGDRQAMQPAPVARSDSQQPTAPEAPRVAPSPLDQPAPQRSTATTPALPASAAPPAAGPVAAGQTVAAAARTSPPSSGQSGPPAAPDPEQTKAMAALQEQIRKATQTLATLESQVTQTRQDLASLKTQNGQTAPSSPQAAGAGVTAAGGQSTRPARRQDGAGSPEAVGSPGGADPSGASAGQGRGPDLAARSAPPPPPVERPQVAQAAGPALRQRPVDLRPADVRGPNPRTADTAAFDSQPDPRIARAAPIDPRFDDDATQAALGRLRRQSMAGPVATPVQPDRVNEPHRVPTIERLEDARAAVVEGRIEDAKRYLQAAQVQLVFRPVGPGQDQPRLSQATGPVSQALLALNTGDRGRAIIAIDQAAGALSAGTRAMQFGSIPAGENTWPPPVARTGP